MVLRLAFGMQQLKKSELALQYQVSEKSIQRDMSSLRDFMEERDLSQELIYDTKQSAYHLIARRKHGLCDRSRSSIKSRNELISRCMLFSET